LVDCRFDLVGETLDAFTQSVVLRQLLSLGDQRLALRYQSVSPEIQFLAAAQKLRTLDEIALVQIGQSAALGSSGVDLAIELGNLGSKQLVVACLASR
jgi:hypothetical protein